MVFAIFEILVKLEFEAFTMRISQFVRILSGSRRPHSSLPVMVGVALVVADGPKLILFQIRGVVQYFVIYGGRGALIDPLGGQKKLEISVCNLICNHGSGVRVKEAISLFFVKPVIDSFVYQKESEFGFFDVFFSEGV